MDSSAQYEHDPPFIGSPFHWLLSLQTSEKKKKLQRSSIPQNRSGIIIIALIFM